MKLVIFLHYFLSCLFGSRHLPRIIEYNGEEWFSVGGYEKDYWFVCYSKYIDKFVTEELIEVHSKYRYFAYLKMVCQLWKWRSKINFAIDYE